MSKEFLSGINVVGGILSLSVHPLASSSGSIAIDLAVGNNFSHTLTENTTLAAPSNPVVGMSGKLSFTQHASSAKTLAFDSFWEFPYGSISAITTSLSTTEVYQYFVVASNKAIISKIGTSSDTFAINFALG